MNKIFSSPRENDAMTTQVQAELADFEDVLREHEISLNISKDIRSTTQEYEDTMQILEEFLKIQDGFAFEHENNSSIKQSVTVLPMEEDAAINFDVGVHIPGLSAAELGNLYLAEVDVDMKFMDSYLDPAWNIDLNEYDLDDLFIKEVNNSITPDDKPNSVAETPHLSHDLQDPGYIDGKEHQYGHSPFLIAQVDHNDLIDKDISVNVNYNNIPTEYIGNYTDDIPIDTDDVSTEPEDNSTDNED